MGALSILLLTDLQQRPPKDQDFSDVIGTEGWKSQGDVFKALTRMGHDVRIFGVHDDITPMVEELYAHRPDVVFNLCEAFNDDRRLEPHVAGLIELMKIPMTGCGLESLLLCKDKGLSKKILSFHRIRIPKFVVSSLKRPLKKLGVFPFPGLVKPLGLEASEGITQLCLVHDEASALERVEQIQKKWNVDVIVEEFVEGRELYVSVLGNDRLIALPPRELVFAHVEDEEKRIATFKAKWDDAYRKRHGIRTQLALPLADGTADRLRELAKKIYRLFGMRGYGRIDFRLSEKGEIVFLEANPNPAISREDDFSLSASAADLNYEALLDRIIKLAMPANAELRSSL